MYEITRPRMIYSFSMTAAYLVLCSIFLLSSGETVPPTCNIIAPIVFLAFGLMFLLPLRRTPKDEIDQLSIWPAFELAIGDDTRFSLPRLAVLVFIAVLVALTEAYMVNPTMCQIFSI